MGDHSTGRTTASQRIGAALRARGFRWVFPIGTLPIPFHPLMAVLVLLFAPVWFLAALLLPSPGASGGVTWLPPLVTGLLLGVPLSIPIVAWVMMVLRGPLVQALFFTAGLALLAIDVARGREEPVWGLVPTAYGLVWLTQWLGGRVLLCRWQRALAAFVPIATDSRTVVMPSRRQHAAHALVTGGHAARVYLTASGPNGEGRLIERIAAEDAAALGALNEGKPPRGWTLTQASEAWVLARPAGEPAGARITLDAQPWRGPARVAGLATGELLVWRIGDESGAREVVTGVARVVGPWPLATLFHWTAIYGGRSEWVVGFMRRQVRLTDYPADGILGLFAPVAGEPGPSAALIDEARETITASRRAEEERRRQRQDGARAAVRQRPKAVLIAGRGKVSVHEGSSVADFWAAVAENPAAWTHHQRAYERALRLAPDLGREGLLCTLDWFDAAVAGGAREAAAAAARLIAAMDEAQLAGERDRLTRTFNSRVLGMVWRLTPDFDPKPLPARIPRFGEEAGFGLIREAPELYRKLARLGPVTERITAGLAGEALRYGIALPGDLAAMAALPSATG